MKHLELCLCSALMATSVTAAAAAAAASAVEAPDDCGTRADFAVQVLGSGGPVADDARSSAAYVLWIDGHSRALVDAGGGTFLRFGEAGARFEDLDFVGLSHFHTDHSADFPALLKSGYFSGRSRALQVAGPAAGGRFPGLHAYLDGLLNARNGIYAYLAGYLDGTEGLVKLIASEIPHRSGAPVTVDPDPRRLTVDAFYVPHGNVPTLAFRLTAGERVIVFASDQNGDDPEFAQFASGADLLVMHMAISQNAGNAAKDLHATPEEIGRIAESARAETLVLSHFMARSLRALDVNLDAIRARYRGPVIVAEDLTCVSLASN